MSTFARTLIIGTLTVAPLTLAPHGFQGGTSSAGFRSKKL